MYRFLVVPLLVLFSCAKNPSTKTESQLTTTTSLGEIKLVTDSVCNCSVSAYLAYNNLEVYDAPDGVSIDTLTFDEDCECLIVQFYEAQGGWLRTDEGWVEAEYFEVSSRNYEIDSPFHLYIEPYSDSIIYEYRSESTFTVVSCFKDWILVKDTYGANEGWSDKSYICDNPLTTCS